MASTPTRDLPEEFLAATRKSQETMIRAIRTWVETVRTVTPKLPSVPGPLADRLPKLPSVAAPFADRLPTPEDVVASGYDFAEQLLAIQRKFAEDVLAATEPLIPGHGKRAWQDATRTDAATAAAKQTATAAKQTATAAKTAVTGTVQAAEQAVAEVTPKLRVTAPAPKAQSAPSAATPVAPKAPAASAATPVAPKAPAAARKAPAKPAPKPATPKPAAAKPATPKSAAAKNDPKPATPRRAPKSTGTR